MAGLNPARVAEVLAARGHNSRWRGSGYQVGDRWVLTTAHLVSDADTAVVRFEADRPGEWSAPARVALASTRADVALLELSGTARDGGESPTYGAVPETDALLPFTTMGFPRFKLRRDHGADTAYRDSCHASGKISALSNRREGTLELLIEPPESDPDPTRSPWEGMSGAAVWHHSSLIGLVNAHHRADGLGRLAAVRVDRWYELMNRDELDLLHRTAGLPPTLADLTQGTAPTPNPDGPVSLVELPENLPLRELDGLVTALTALPSVSDRNGLTLILDSIDPVISAMSPRSNALRPDVFGILRTCLRYRGTLDQLLEAIRLMEGESAGVARMDQEAVELSRRHR
ncbi:effector-associated domain 2-containing protein [Streptomyces sp. NPDC003635]